MCVKELYYGCALLLCSFGLWRDTGLCPSPKTTSCRVGALLPRRPNSSRIAEGHSRSEKSYGSNRRSSRSVDSETGRLAPSLRSGYLRLFQNRGYGTSNAKPLYIRMRFRSGKRFVEIAVGSSGPNSPTIAIQLRRAENKGAISDNLNFGEGQPTAP
jgi:hypothetical protein